MGQVKGIMRHLALCSHGAFIMALYTEGGDTPWTSELLLAQTLFHNFIHRHNSCCNLRKLTCYNSGLELRLEALMTQL